MFLQNCKHRRWKPSKKTINSILFEPLCQFFHIVQCEKWCQGVSKSAGFGQFSLDSTNWLNPVRLLSPSASIAIDTLSMLFFNRPPHPSLTHSHHRRHHCILILPRLSRRSLTFRMRCSFFKTSRGEAWLKSNLWYPLKMCVCCAAVWVGCLGPPIVKEPKVLRVLEREIRESHTHTTHTLVHTHPHNMAVSRRPLGEFSGKAWWE